MIIKKKIGVVLCLVVLLISILTICNSIVVAESRQDYAYTVYVDCNSIGLEKGTKSMPFKSIEKAKAYVRTLDKTKGNIKVEIAGGVYELSKSLEFTEEDSGNENCTIKYVAKNEEYPIISGGQTITGRWKSEGNGIYSTSLNRDEKLRSLYVNGHRCYMTSKKVQALGGAGSYYVEAGASDWAWISGSGYSATKFSLSSIPVNTRNQDDIELMSQSSWNTTTVCVDSLEKNGALLYANLQMPYGAIAQTLGWGNEYGFSKSNTIYNVFEWLDEPGEFYFDKTAHKLYYYPIDGENMNKANVVVPYLENILNVKGENINSKVTNISFEGLTIAYSDWNLCKVGDSYGRATNQAAASLYAYAEQEWHNYIYRAYDLGPAAIMVSSASHIAFKDTSVCHTGNDGLSIINDVVKCSLIGNAIYDTAGAALVVGHPQHMYIGDKNSDIGIHSDKEKYSSTQEAVCKSIIVNNCLFKDTSNLFMGDPGVMVYVAENLSFVNNRVEDTPYSGISIGWGWWNMNGDSDSVVPGNPTATTKNNTINNNKFINTIHTLDDGGAIYTLSDMPGTTISNNYIKTIGGKGSKVRGIHADEGSKHLTGENNVFDIDTKFSCIDCGDWGRKGNNTWRNNYSTTNKYSTEPILEQNTICENLIVESANNWSLNAQEIINNSGIKTSYLNSINDRIDYEQSYRKNNTALFVIIGVVCGVVIIGVIVFVVIYAKKRKRNKLLINDESNSTMN